MVERIELRPAATSGTYWMADSSSPAAMPAALIATPRTSRHRPSMHTAHAAASAMVATSETGSPASAWQATTTASSVAAVAVFRSNARSSAQNTYGTVAIDQDRFGKFAVETIGPETAKATPPNADDRGDSWRRRNRYIPSADSGMGSATHRL